VPFGGADGDEEVGFVLALEGFDQVLIDRAGLAQTGQGVAPDGGAAVDDGDVLKRLHRAQADLAAQLDGEQNILGVVAIILRDESGSGGELRELDQLGEGGRSERGGDEGRGRRGRGCDLDGRGGLDAVHGVTPTGE
jgi:hypothetical protein